MSQQSCILCPRMLGMLQYSSLAAFVPSLNLREQYHGSGMARVGQKPGMARLDSSSTLSSKESTRLTWRAARRNQKRMDNLRTKILTSTTHSICLDPLGSPIPHVPNETNVVCGAAGHFFLTSSWTKAAVVLHLRIHMQSSQKKLRIKKNLECSLMWHSIYAWLCGVPRAR
ncbi:hypothetical protein M441DRAFT_366915 [Trichoderma asperellum CBS 433.97]|uniref:Uncharacterized protein n=1 Tax=Trichoderma asperellum (strain ATCC 204424 / CBS 433.97 / NBRC 101777) TaxID=1042311 RepID=A0A2T3ZED2_TRIA4|nr:hypothetical protein M441DRAFT_366915 [Trichoderma asperellum CBS 433.97]PTB43172.1 hypothetical protein M441DRAFT_366915 [Trichoderma asperellum CBS 433.97]